MTTPTDSNDWDHLLTGLRAGDEQVSRDFYERYGALLERLAARHLASGLKRRVDGDEVAHSVCRTFLRRAKEGAFTLEGRDDLWRLLTAITLSKVRKKVGFHRAQRRDAAREHHPSGEEDASLLTGRAGGAPDPFEVAAFRDALDTILGSLDAEERQLVVLELDQRRDEDIAAAMGCSERTVRRLRRRLRDRLESLLDVP